MSQYVDVAVIGGGIIGCSIAYYLAKEGLSVHLLESRKIAQGTTSAAAGMLGAHSEYVNYSFYSFARKSQSLYKSFLTESSSHFDYMTGGILQLAQSNEERTVLSEWQSATYFSAARIGEHIPYLAPPTFGAYLFEDDVHVHPTQACLAFYYSAQKLGATFSEHEGDAFRIVCKDSSGDSSFQIINRKCSSNISAKHVVIAGGSASSTLVPGLNMTVVKGQCMQLDAQGMRLPHTLFHKGQYIVPRSDGTLVVGATMEPYVTDSLVTAQGTSELNAIAEGFIPGLSQFPVLNRWAGHRPKTVDELPYIGHIPGKKNMYIAAGHFRNGILLAPATACMIRDLIMENEISKEWTKTFNPTRGISHEKEYSTKWQLV